MNMFSEYTRAASELTELIERLKSDIIPTVEDYKLALSCIDLTTLNGNDTHEKVEALCKQAIDFYQPEKWVETTEKKENGSFKMQPATAIIGEKLKILTTRKTVSQLM